MQILKAYADAGATGNQNFGLMPGKTEAGERGRPKTQLKSSGDSLNISQAARDMLENGGAGQLSSSPHDLTYDQYGNINRDFENIQSDLRQLAGQLATHAGDAVLRGGVNAMRSRLASLRQMV